MRILPQEVANAFAGKGLLPGTGSILFRDGRNRLKACGLGAIAFKPGDELYVDNMEALPEDWPTLYERVNKKYGVDYVDGFIPGFDGHERPNSKVLTARMLEGYSDGQAARALILL